VIANGKDGYRAPARDPVGEGAGNGWFGLLLGGGLAIAGEPILELGRGVMIGRFPLQISRLMRAHVGWLVMGVAVIGVGWMEMVQRRPAEGKQQGQNHGAVEGRAHVAFSMARLAGHGGRRPAPV